MTRDLDGVIEPSYVPAVTACGLCAGETLAGRDTLDGGQRTRLEQLAASGVARLLFADCLDECNRGDVLVVRPDPAARRSASARPVWFERLAGEGPTAALRLWLAEGGPGVAPLPALLAGHVIGRTDVGHGPSVEP